MPSVRYDLVVEPDMRAVIHPTRAAGGAGDARPVHEGALALDPPGPTVALDDLMPAASP